MKKIAVVEKFFESHHQQQIETVAGKHGYTVDYYLDGVLPKERAGEYEIVYGMPDRTALKDMTQLKWFCASFAGVDRYVDEALYPHEGVLLSNSAGAYGVTIAEHIMMVTLMLLRQMMPTMKAVGERVWLPPLPVRSICGANITVLGTGDIGASFAQRAKAMGAKSICGVRRTIKPADPAFDRIVTLSALDSVLPETDILVMALPSTGETVGVLSRERIALLPPQAIVVNVGRGTAVDRGAERRTHRRCGAGCVCPRAAAPGSFPVGDEEPADHPPRGGQHVPGLYPRQGRGHVLRGSGELRCRSSAGPSGQPEAGVLRF